MGRSFLLTLKGLHRISSSLEYFGMQVQRASFVRRMLRAERLTVDNKTSLALSNRPVQQWKGTYITFRLRNWMSATWYSGEKRYPQEPSSEMLTAVVVVSSIGNDIGTTTFEFKSCEPSSKLKG